MEIVRRVQSVVRGWSTGFCFGRPTGCFSALVLTGLKRHKKSTQFGCMKLNNKQNVENKFLLSWPLTATRP